MAINIFTASGHIGSDCTTRSTAAGKLIASFSLPVKQGFGKYEKTSWVRCQLLGMRAEKLPSSLTRGTKVTVSGQFVLEKYTPPGSAEKVEAVIIVSDIELHGRREPAQDKSLYHQKTTERPALLPEPAADFDDAIPF